MNEQQMKVTDRMFGQVDAALREYFYRVGLPMKSFLSIKLEEALEHGAHAYKLRLRFERGISDRTWGKDIIRTHAELTGTKAIADPPVGDAVALEEERRRLGSLCYVLKAALEPYVGKAGVDAIENDVKATMAKAAAVPA